MMIKLMLHGFLILLQIQFALAVVQRASRFKTFVKNRYEARRCAEVLALRNNLLAASSDMLALSPFVLRAMGVTAHHVRLCEGRTGPFQVMQQNRSNNCPNWWVSTGGGSL